MAFLPIHSWVTVASMVGTLLVSKTPCVLWSLERLVYCWIGCQSLDLTVFCSYYVWCVCVRGVYVCDMYVWSMVYVSVCLSMCV